MRKFSVAIVFLFLISGLFASPFNGHWKVELFGNNGSMTFDCNDNLFIINSPNGQVNQKVVIDENKKLISIPVFNGLCNQLLYVEKDNGIIDCFISGELNLDFSSLVLGKIDDQNMNSVTIEGYDILIKTVQDAFYKIPILRFTKIDE